MSETFHEFATARLDGLLRYATALTCDPHLAQDVVQEVLIRAQRGWHRIGAVEYPDAYLRRMIVNEYLSWRRCRANRDLAVSHPILAECSTVDDPAAVLAERDAMRVRIARLPRRQRAAIVLRYYVNLTDPQIAEVLGCSTATVRSHIRHALVALRAQDTTDSEHGATVALLPTWG